MNGSSTQPPVLRSGDGPVAILTLNRPERMNAVSLELYRALDEELAGAARDPEVRVIVLTGSGRAFCVGADLDEHSRGTGGADARRSYVEAAQAVNRRIQTVPRVVVAAANGHAIGAGFELLLACDLVVVARDSKYRLPELSLGTFVGGGVTRNLLRTVGRARAHELLYLCPVLSGTDIFEMGLANRAVPAEHVMDESVRIAVDIATRAPLSVARTKELLGVAAESSLDEVLRLEGEALLDCMNSDDWAEGIEAFQEKRAPRFLGR